MDEISFRLQWSSARSFLTCLLVISIVSVGNNAQEPSLQDLVRGERVVSGTEHRTVFKTTYTDETDYRNARPDQLIREVIRIVIEAEESNYTFGERETFGPPTQPTRRPRPTLRPTTSRPTTTTTQRPRNWITFDGRRWFLFDFSKLPAGWFDRRSIREIFNINFRTNQPDALIWFIGNDRDNMHLSLKDGILYLTVTQNGIVDRTVRIHSDGRLDDNQLHNVTVSRHDRRIMVDIDGTKTIKYLTQDFHFIDRNNVMYFGGSDDTSQSHLTQSHVNVNFDGTINDATTCHRSYVAMRNI